MTLLRTGLGVGDVLLEGKRLLHLLQTHPQPLSWQERGVREPAHNTSPSLFEEKGTGDEFIFTP
jgi:hypothetical protein